MDIVNIKRGLFRIWAVGTALFILISVLFCFGDIEREFERAAGDGIIVFPSHPWWMVGSLAMVTTCIPLVILIIGGGICWVVEGFSGTPKRCDS